jgi:Terminase small subunit
MPVLPKHKHELFAQGLAKGLSADAAYQAAGYKRDRGNATRLTANDSIQKRVVEIQDKAAENVEVSKAWVMERLKEIVERAMQAVPHLDHEGNPTGVYTYQGNVRRWSCWAESLGCSLTASLAMRIIPRCCAR